MVYNGRIGNVFITAGIMKAIGLGIHISRYGFDFEFLCFYGGLEW